MDFDDLSTFARFLSAGSAVMVLAVAAAIADRMQSRRRDLDRISTVPWGFLSVIFSMMAVILLSTAAKAWFRPG
ncbi:hypothetical protein [Novosphingobium sp. Chol11]|uniref:hypothetical protein n=1 Tax=Novosphingobium sp. Chol11 TaxID=1385763 RepID=UPI0025F1C513|nr:hypothetical protein [Novosphingobium sp. Chol11]